MLPELWEYSDFSNGKDSAGKIRTFKDIVYHRSDNERIFLRLSVSPLRYRSGHEEGKMLVVQDITEIKQIEEDMKKVESLALVGEMAAGEEEHERHGREVMGVRRRERLAYLLLALAALVGIALLFVARGLW